MFRTIKFILIFLVILGGLGWLSYSLEIKSPLDKEGESRQFVVSKGEGLSQIAKNLAETQIIRSSFYFKIYVWRAKLEDKIQAGAYSLGPNLSIKEIVKIITTGEIINNQAKITLIEGWNINDIAENLAKQGLIDKNKFLALVQKKQDLSLYDLNFQVNSLEGYLFPDTYFIFQGSSEEEIINKLLNNFKQKISAKMLEDIKKQNKNLKEIIIMASLIEKEVQAKKDMKIVSGIFWNRIKDNMRLESDAPLTYILNDKTDAHNYSDTQIDSPYNTYLYKGLPPGPIANPGLDAILAAIYPESSSYYYFLTGKNGQTYFAKTYEEHLANKAKYLK